ncbi:MAG: dienelactone hydrolase family protein [Anaerolinea sp.]|nr:dienelactone hydrolase family protein [Anaerolinea sp.]
MSQSALWRWLKRALISLLVLIAILVGGIIVVMFYDANAGQQTDAFTNITYIATDGTELLGYLAEPSGTGPHPGVLLLHEWWGLNEEITHIADALAAEGYMVFVPDAYRGQLATQFPGALYLRLGTPEADIFADIDAGLAYLHSLPNVDVTRVASWGFCFGGEQSLQLALRQPDKLAAMIMYYGSVETDAERLRPLLQAQPILGIFGDEDAQIPVSKVNAFQDALNEIGVSNTITIYPGVGHAFLTAENYDKPGASGDAWQQTLAFLEAVIGNR